MAWRPPLPGTMPVWGWDTRQHLPEQSLGAVAGPPPVAIAEGLSMAQKGRVWTLTNVQQQKTKGKAEVMKTSRTMKNAHSNIKGMWE